MRFIDYFVFRVYNFYRDQLPVGRVIFGLTMMVSSALSISINAIELLLGKKIVTMETNSWLVFPILICLLPVAIYTVYFMTGRYKRISFIETKRQRITRGIGVVMVFVCLFLGAMAIYTIRFNFFGDIPKE